MKHFVLILSLTFLLLNVAMSLAHSQPSDMRIHQLPEQKPLEDSNGDHHHCIHDHILTQSHPAPVTRQDYGVPDEVVHGAHAELAKRGPGALINEPYVHESGPTSRRLLNHVTFQGIRIYFYTVYMNSGQDNGRTCYNVGDSVLVYTGPTAPVNPPDCSSTVTSNCRLTCASEHVLTTTKKNFITAVSNSYKTVLAFFFSFSLLSPCSPSPSLLFLPGVEWNLLRTLQFHKPIASCVSVTLSSLPILQFNPSGCVWGFFSLEKNHPTLFHIGFIAFPTPHCHI
eukprot:TRINITY_DN155_c0_g1_i16.p1 TRINITY_DN155_c0_g1~~TRINITY_DN155_c0_g1_i16.p1  ORF type:complete len:290 (-),score=-1.88 TRINITY_DN155_c0_g1_i16:198-1046(-)